MTEDLKEIQDRLDTMHKDLVALRERINLHTENELRTWRAPTILGLLIIVIGAMSLMYLYNIETELERHVRVASQTGSTLSARLHNIETRDNQHWDDHERDIKKMDRRMDRHEDLAH